MAYIPPTGGVVDFGLLRPYTPPIGSATNFYLPVGTGLASPSLVPGVISEVGAAYETGTRADAEPTLGFNWPPARDPLVGVSHDAAIDVHDLIAVPWGSTTKMADERAVAWAGTGATLERETASPWAYLPWKDDQRAVAWDHSIKPADRGQASLWDVLVGPGRRDQAKDQAQYLPFFRVDDYANPYPDWPIIYYPPLGDITDFDLASGYAPPGIRDVDIKLRELPVQPIIPHDMSRRVPFTVRSLPATREADAKETITALPWGPGQSQFRIDPVVRIVQALELPDPGDGGIPDAITAEVYKLMAAIDCIRLSDSAPVLLNEIVIKGDLESWAWGVTASPATRADLDLIKPTASGPQEIQVTINGYVFTFVIEGYSIDRKFGSSGFSVTGRSLTAYLAAPYAPARATTQDNARNALQLIDEELTNTGFISDYQAQDWLVPGGVWSYSGLTAMQAIQRIAQASGAVIQSDPALKTMHILKRYPTSPWDWAAGAADYAVDQSYLATLAEAWRPSPTYNAVHVIGQTSGVIVHTTRQGSAGDLPAPMIVEPLCTDMLAGKERGRTIIANSGDRSDVTAVLPLYNATGYPGLILPGKMVGMIGAGDDYKALATGVEITGRRSRELSVRQRITLERYRG